MIRNSKLAVIVWGVWAFFGGMDAGFPLRRDREGIDDYLPAPVTSGGGENSTQPLDPQVIGPLLIWAIRMVDDFAGDILAGWAENRRLTHVAENNPAVNHFAKPRNVRCSHHGAGTKRHRAVSVGHDRRHRHGDRPCHSHPHPAGKPRKAGGVRRPPLDGREVA